MDRRIALALYVALCVAAPFIGVMVSKARAEPDIYFTANHYAFKAPLPHCINKGTLFKALEQKLKHPVSWTGRDESKPVRHVIYSNDEKGTWFLVIAKTDSVVACIVARGNESRNFFGGPT